MKVLGQNIWEDGLTEQATKVKRSQLSEHDLEELREHIDLISFNIGKVYRHAKDRSRKEYNKARHTLRRKIHHSYKNEKIRS
ncbi:MAG: hypothetical protein PHY93_05595 [Bacteriovorax sp.]|nr:hypothetical protein [Bacteriovorax sp.]